MNKSGICSAEIEYSLLSYEQQTLGTRSTATLTDSQTEKELPSYRDITTSISTKELKIQSAESIKQANYIKEAEEEHEDVPRLRWCPFCAAERLTKATPAVFPILRGIDNILGGCFMTQYIKAKYLCSKCNHYT